MNLPRVWRLWLVPAALGGLPLVAACSEDGQSFGPGKCPELPLYTWDAGPTDPGTDKAKTVWTRVDVNTNQPITADQEAAIKAAEDAGCITPAGEAVYLNAGGATSAGGATGSGGGATDGGP